MDGKFSAPPSRGKGDGPISRASEGVFWGMPHDHPSITVTAFQDLIRQRYYATDSARGIPGTFMWFIEEVGELSTALMENAPGKTPTETQRANLSEEFADVLAWLMTLANIAGVDLAAALSKYTDPDRVKGVKD